MPQSLAQTSPPRRSPTAQFRARPKGPRRLPDLPQFYYHTHFCDMLSTVDRLYGSILHEAPSAFLNRFAALPFAAQCAYVRIASRKGYIFDRAKLNYPEIENFRGQIEYLKDRGFVRPLTTDDIGDYLRVLTKPDIIALLDTHLCKSAFKRSWKKDILIDTAQSLIAPEAIATPERFIAQGQRAQLRYLLYLYFGRIEDNLQPFTLRDLGLVKTADYKAALQPRFDNAEAAKAAYFYASGLHDFRHGTEERLTAVIDSVETWPEPLCSISTAARDKLLQKLGGLSERLGDVETALLLYGRSDTPLCNERAIRLLYNRNQGDDREDVKHWLERLIDNPSSDGEHDFAVDFYGRKYDKKRTSPVTDMLRAGETLALDEAYRNAPEYAAKRHYEGRGYRVYRTENAPWKMLFGLLFWELLYGENSTAIHSSFQRLPSDLKTGTFYTQHKDAIEAALSQLNNPAKLLLHILKTTTRHHGTPNGIFRWSSKTLDKVKVLIEAAPRSTLSDMIRIMAQDYTHTHDGFPDLMRIKDGTLSFVEVKAQGDVLRRNQLTRIKQLQSCGLPTEIARIDWTVDPNQIYVVVDIETTGGRAGDHRVTEIGAVKMQGGVVIDEWQSLINPQRSIPHNITRLTGISEAMVAGAPMFADIADDFAAFMGDSIFVAHNVNFDYGFLKMEYGRLERHFRFPKLCSCASMRKLYPGHRSYSLKNLTDAFDIDLSSHHRALCDARAAAELLILINEKRVENAA